MPAKRTGSVRCRSGRYEARVYIAAEKKQASIHLPHAKDAAGAQERAQVLADVAVRVARAGQDAFLRECLQAAAVAKGAKTLANVLASVERLCTSGVEAAKPAGARTFQDVGENWTSGELARLHPDHVGTKKTAGTDIYRLERHVYPIVGKTVIADFKLEHAEAVMRALPPELTGSRRQVAQLLHRILHMSVYPLRLREANPIPRGWLPKPSGDKALVFLYPEEDAALLACTTGPATEAAHKARGRPTIASQGVPLGYRVLYGFLAREGCRVGDAIGEVVKGGGRTPGLEWTDIDLVRGAIKLDENKTNDPRWWAMNPGVTRALRIWRAMNPRARFVFDVGITLPDDHMAERFRSHLRAAGITRPELFERSAVRLPLRVHDLRATFITLALAHGKTEAWVSARTGHTTSDMINRYRRVAKTAEELNMPDLAPLDEAIPELRAAAELVSAN